MSKITRKEKALIKDLELQIDYLIGWTPQGLHWKQEWAARQSLLDATMAGENTPPSILEKINHIQEKIWELKNKESHDQSYFKMTEEELRNAEKGLEKKGIVFYGTKEFDEQITQEQRDREFKLNEGETKTPPFVDKLSQAPSSIPEFIARQNFLLSKAADKWITWCDQFGDNRESDGISHGWEVEFFLAKEEKEEWRFLQQKVEKIMMDNLKRP